MRPENKTPQEIVDRYHKNIKNSFSEFGISFDNYSRTSSKVHHETASKFFLKLLENDSFKELTSEQFYDEIEEQFLPDRFLIGTCPKCGKWVGDRDEGRINAVLKSERLLDGLNVK